MQAAITLVIIGVLLGFPTALHAFLRPRKEGEPLDAERKTLLGLSLLGLLCILTGGAMFIAVNR